MPFALIEDFNQNVLEEHFGKHRSIGRRNDNPDLYHFGHNSNIIGMHCSIMPVKGNTTGVINRNVALLGFQLTMHLFQNDIERNGLLMIQMFLTQNVVILKYLA